MTAQLCPPLPAGPPAHPTSRRNTRHGGERARNPRTVKDIVNLSHGSLLTSTHSPIPLIPRTCSPERSSFTFCRLGRLLWSRERSGASPPALCPAEEEGLVPGMILPAEIPQVFPFAPLSGVAQPVAEGGNKRWKLLV